MDNKNPQNSQNHQEQQTKDIKREGGKEQSFGQKGDSMSDRKPGNVDKQGSDMSEKDDKGMTKAPEAHMKDKEPAGARN